MNDLQIRPFHNRGVDSRTLAGIGAPPVTHGPRGGYVADPALSKRSPPQPVRPNSAKRIECPVEPVPARHAP
ncbi:hypothetical protein [Paraburkholderia ferrariae]|uniref:Uncharacterized protein n=1 Tax=Paraburkholderia ferrariae TaxID=386056 RepID=A0ABU9RIG4_9BURK